MGSYKWSLSHQVTDEVLDALLLRFGFELEDDEEVEGEKEFSIQINDWKPLYLLREAGKNEIVLTFHWMGDSTTEVYYDYLIHCGVLIGKLMVAMETISKQNKPSESD